jgi:predicted extracellular nuclease
MAATAGKVALVSSTTALSGACPTVGIIDFVGYGTTASCFEGSGRAPAPSNTTSDQRVGGGATDTNDNAADFAVAAPDPHGTSDPAPTVGSSIPSTGASGVALASDITITFSEAVTTTGSWFTISCSLSGAHTATVTGGPVQFVLNPDADFSSSESCTVTVVAANVTDQDTDDPPDNMTADATITFTTIDAAVCGDPGVTFIHDIQGSGLSSPISGSIVSIEGTVVGDYQQTGGFNGYYVEEEASDFDADTATSEGIFVFNTATAVSVGDHVRVKGTVTEFNLLTELTAISSVLLCSTGNPLPAPATISLPVASLNDWEPVEGMLVSLSQTLTVTEVFNLGRFGEVSLSGTGRLPNPTNVVAPGAPSIALEDLNDRSRIILDDGDNQQNIDPTIYPQGGLSASNTLRVGDSLPSLTGIGDQRFGNYRIQPTGPISFNHTNPRPAAPGAVGGNLRVASFNVLNFFNGDGLGGGFPTPRGANTLTEFNRQLAKEVSAITALDADIVGLMELENDAPGHSAIEDLVAALNAATAPGTYAFIDTGIIGTDQIRVGLLYQPAAVTPIGAFETITTAVDPRFIDTKNRPSLAQTFESNLTGGRLTVVVNHLKSKGSDCNDVGDPDTGDGQGNCNLTRKHAAEAIVDWLATDPTGAGDADYLLIGDMNSYAMEDPISTFKANGFEDTISTHIGAGAYSYVFDGESGYLDHALASTSLAAQVTGVAEWHINPDEPTVLDYNTEFKTANQINTFYDPGPYRSSDHDPVLVGIDLNTGPSVDAGGPYAVNSGSSVLVSATGNDPDGQPLTYAWDLDDNGSFETAGQTVSFDASAIAGPATITIHVQVTDAGGATATADATVTVNAHPTVDAGGPYTVNEGSSVTVTATGNDPEGGTLTYAWDLDDNGSFETAGASATFNAPAGSAPSSPTIRVRVTDPDGLTATATTTVRITWVFTGFLSPLSNPPVENSAKAGSGLPIKFMLGGNQGLAVIAAGYPRSISYTCGIPLGSRPTDATTPTASTGFTYDAATGIYNYSWKTDKGWMNTCRRFVLKLTDGSYHYVDVHFTK